MKSKAVLVANNYAGTEAELRGCENDARALKEILVSRLGFREEDVEVRTDVTRDALLRALSDLAATARSESLDLAFFSYSGHGCSVPDRSGDESDHMDEAVYCSDKRLVLDDEITAALKMFPAHCRVRAIMDCCHSGTIFDLPYVWPARVPDRSAAGGEWSADVMMLSGCMDSQTSADAYDASRRKYMGALTSAFLDNVGHVGNASALLTGIRKTLARRRMAQRPVLTSTRPGATRFM